MAGLKDRVIAMLRRERARRPWLDHLIRAYQQYKGVNADRQQRLEEVISENVPGSLGDTLTQAVQSVINNRGSLGVIALLGVAYAGLGWVGNLRTGVQLVWASEVTKENFVKAKLEDLVVLVGLGVGIVLS